MEWGWAAAFWPETADDEPRVHAAALPIGAEKNDKAKADASWEKFVDVKLLTHYHRDADAYDVLFADGGEAFSVPRYLIATELEVAKAKENYEKAAKMSGNESDSDHESGSGSEDNASEDGGSDDEGSDDDAAAVPRGGGRSTSDDRKKQDEADKEKLAEQEAAKGLAVELTKLLKQVRSNAPSRVTTRRRRG